MMLPEPSSQVLAVRFGLVVGEREWSGGTERSEWDYYLERTYLAFRSVVSLKVAQRQVVRD
jgi:hypothetical protein